MDRLTINKYKGFTLIEVIIVIIVLGVVASASAPLIYQASKDVMKARDISEVVSQERVVFDRMIREIRLIRRPSDVSTMGATNVFFRTIDGNTIQFQKTGSTITRTFNSGIARILADNVTNLTITYQKSDGSSTAVASEIRYISLSVTFTVNGVAETMLGTAYLPNSR